MLDTVFKWTANEWSAFGNVTLAISATIAGFWTLYNFSRKRRVDHAQWLKQIFVEFYLEDSFSLVRSSLEYSYEDHLSFLVERRFFNRDIPVTKDETSILKELDQLLNYFEHLLYLEQSRLLSRQDRDALFEYWFDILSSREKSAVRRYTAHFGFERVAKALGANEMDLIALYGSLRSGQPAFEELKLERFLKSHGTGEIEGTLYDLGEYPGLVMDDTNSKVKIEIFEIRSPKAIEMLDKFERFDASNRDESLYIRKCVQLLEPDTECWVYVYNTSKDERDYKSAKIITNGDWLEYQKSKN